MAELLAVMSKWEKSTMMFMLGFQFSLGEISEEEKIDFSVVETVYWPFCDSGRWRHCGSCCGMSICI
jgi:hypothetical protein